MSWLIKVLWGALFTWWMLTSGWSAHWLHGIGFGWRCAIIVVVGWWPALLPLTTRKLLGVAWGLGVSFALPAVVSALVNGSEVRITYFQFCLALAVFGWTPLLIPGLARLRRELAFSATPSIFVNSKGRAADWTFKADGVELAVDVIDRELRLRVSSGRWREVPGKWSKGPVELRRPLFQCTVECEPVTKSVVQSTGVHAHGSANGVPVTLFVPTDSYVKDIATGAHRLTIRQTNASWSVVGIEARRRPDGSIYFGGSVHRSFGSELFYVEFLGLSKRAARRFDQEWHKKAKPMIEAAQKAFEAELLEQARSTSTDAFLRDESAANEKRARGDALAQERLKSVRALADVGDEFVDMSHYVDGEILWAIAASRNGRGAVIQGAASWAGSLAGARASVEVAEKGGPKALDTLELCVEVTDPQFEREHLAKRRFKVMRGLSKDRIAAWADRIDMIAQLAAREEAGAIPAERGADQHSTKAAP